MKNSTICTECSKTIIIADDAQVGDIIICDSKLPENDEGCYSEFEIVSLQPLQIILIEEEK